MVVYDLEFRASLNSVKQVTDFVRSQREVFVATQDKTVLRLTTLLRPELAVEESYQLLRDWTFNLATPPRTLLRN